MRLRKYGAVPPFLAATYFGGRTRKICANYGHEPDVTNRCSEPSLKTKSAYSASITSLTDSTAQVMRARATRSDWYS